MPAEDELSFLEKPQAQDELGRLAHYRVLKELGRGGMGCVLLGEDTKLQRQVALKVMLPRFARDANAKERFLREARAAARIKHDHVITIFQVDEANSVPFIALEFLEGASLNKYLTNKGALPLGVAVRIGREIAEGLAAVHKQGLIHRDIKLENVWLEAPKGRVKLLDFGLTRAEADDTHLTQSGVIMGTPAFMAPEQARGEKVDGRCDLFSLGVVLYRLCTGKQPFTGPSTTAVLTAIAIDTPASPRSVNAQIPESLEKVITKLLEKDPARRYASAKEVIADLNRVLKELALASKVEAPTEAIVPIPSEPRPSGSGAVSSPQSGFQPTLDMAPARDAASLPDGRGSDGRRLKVIVGGVLALLALAVAAWFLIPRGTKTPVVVPKKDDISAKALAAARSPRTKTPVVVPKKDDPPVVPAAKEPPPLNATNAKEVQSAWATKLKVPIEEKSPTGIVRWC